MTHSTPGQTTDDVQLRDIVQTDLPIFFEQQRDLQANYMAAFTAPDPENWGAFTAHWARIINDDAITLQTIVFRGQVAGYVVSHNWFGELEVSYWLGRPYWGQGVATQALRQFLVFMPIRPLHARVAQDNIASLRVLQKCGFTVIGESHGFANARQQEVAEFILKLT